MTSDVTDEHLCAYLDGQLDARERATLEGRLAEDQRLRGRLSALAAADEALRSAFDDAALGPTPAHLAAMVDRPRSSNVLRFPTFDRHAWRAPIAAGFVLAIAGGAFLTGRSTAPASSPMVIASGSELGALLDAAPSGERRTTAGGTFQAVATLRTEDGVYCREFDVAQETAGFTGLACLRDGDWRIEVAAANVVADGQGYAPVSGPDETVNAAVERLGAEALSAEAEASLLRTDWRR